MKSIVSSLGGVVAATLVIGTTAAHAVEIKVIASLAVKQLVLDLAPAFEKSSGHKATTIRAGTEAMTRRIRGGEVVDVVLITAPNSDTRIAEGRREAP
jgi:ABC-type molybdate transport system substrate-binding protein